MLKDFGKVSHSHTKLMEWT